ncbi:lactadherin-like [Patiria miniata]|uniref:F5/8 type C domain-containing protein n=1 Tax=Patiria miniata TaxID=46514 RepID=A0A914A6V4_PATMI|nr:lactadherin-like [Patiria miniata]
MELTTLITGDCNTANDGPMGMASGLIPDNKISVSSNNGFQIGSIRINQNGLCFGNIDANQWVQVDFGGKVYVTGVQCGPASANGVWINEYKVLYGDDGVTWTAVQNAAGTADAVFNGPPDRYTVETSMFPTAVYARYIRLQPTAWGRYICMRFELLGCRY